MSPARKEREEESTPIFATNRSKRRAKKTQPPQQKKTEKRIPTYAVDGTRLRDYAASAVDHLFKLSMVVVRRNKKGVPVSAQFRETVTGANPLRSSSLAGTRYSFLEQIHEVRVWSHRRLIPRSDLEEIAGQPFKTEQECERFVQAIFRAVPLSCIKENETL